MSTNSLGFSIRLCAFFLEQDRMLNGYFRAEGQLSYSEFSLLYAMREIDDPVALEPLAQFLMLRTRTVRQMMLDMEDRGFVTKQSDAFDGRFMLLSLTDVGKAITEKSMVDCYLLMKKSLWSALPEKDMEQYLKTSMRKSVNHLRGFAVAPFGESPLSDLSPMAVDHFIFWRVVIDRWRQLVRDRRDLSLNDFCVLRCLYERGKSEPSEIAHELLFPRSVLSLCKSHLIQYGFVAECKVQEDNRKVLLSCTSQGKRVAKSVFDALNEVTRGIHSNVDEEIADIINAWYARMFVNMWKPHRRS